MRLVVKTANIQASLNKKIANAKNPATFLRSTAFPMWQAFQRKRWMTENTSEGRKWERLDPKYAKRKAIKFASYPGAGRKIMYASGRLFGGVIGETTEHRRVIRGSRMTLSTTVPYAKYPNEQRPYTPLSDKSLNKINKAYRDWVMGRSK